MGALPARLVDRTLQGTSDPGQRQLLKSGATHVDTKHDNPHAPSRVSPAHVRNRCCASMGRSNTTLHLIVHDKNDTYKLVSAGNCRSPARIVCRSPEVKPERQLLGIHSKNKLYITAWMSGSKGKLLLW